MLKFKHCSRCGCDKLFKCFSKNSRGIFYKVCNKCRKYNKKYAKENEEKIKKYFENKKHLQLYHKKWYSQHKNDVYNYNKQWRKINKKKFLKSNKKYYSENRKLNINFNISKKIYAAKEADNKHKREYMIDEYVDKIWVQNTLVFQDFCCYYCNQSLKLINFETRDKKQFTIERLNNDISHHKDNCVIACWECNLKKFSNNQI